MTRIEKLKYECIYLKGVLIFFKYVKTDSFITNIDEDRYVTRNVFGSMASLFLEICVSRAQYAKFIYQLVYQLLRFQCPFRGTINTIEGFLHKEPVSETQSTIRPFSEVPGPKGLPIVGTLFEYFKKGGLSFSKMFEVS